MSLSTQEKILKLVRLIVFGVNSEADNDIITKQYETFLKNLACQFSPAHVPSTSYLIAKIRNCLINNNSNDIDKFMNQLTALKNKIGDDGLNLYLRFFHEFIYKNNNNLNLNNYKSGLVNNSNISLTSFKSIRVEKTREDCVGNLREDSEVTGLIPSLTTCRISENCREVTKFNPSSGGRSVSAPVNPGPTLGIRPDKFFPEKVISQLEKNSIFSPWVLISESLSPGQRESDIVSDLMYTLQGIDGLYIKYDVVKQRHVLDPRVDLPSPVKQIILRICEIGYLFRQLNHVSMIDEGDEGFGMVKKAFSLSVKSYLNDFVRFISTIDNSIFSQPGSPVKFSLPKLLISTMEYQRKFIYLYNASVKCQGLTGGALLSTIYSFSMTGDPLLSTIGCNLLFESSKPINRMLTEWINEGNLSDPYNEFFITVDPKIGNDKFWVLKYSIRSKMIPSFISDTFANKILRIGKSINFIKLICQMEYKIETNFGMLNIEYKNISDSPVASSLNDIVQQIESKINKYVLDLMFTKYELIMHLDALYRYLMLVQGDFIRQLLDLLGPYLSNSADNLRLNNMTSILESAVNSTNAQFDSKEILQRLDCRLAKSSPGDLGWDIFTLYYHTTGPLEIVVDSRSQDKYLKIFKFLWFIKRAGHLMDYISKNNIVYDKKFRNYPAIYKLFKLVNLVKYEIHHFINQLEYFLTFEVLECSKAQFTSRIKQAKDLDDIIRAHDAFLDNVVSLCFLNEESEIILYKFYAIFEKVLQFESIYRNGMGSITAELRRETKQDMNNQGIANAIKYTQNKLINLLTFFRKLMVEFLQSLMESSNQQHYYLAFRLDFNEYYTKRFTEKSMNLSESFTPMESSHVPE